jgi:hypothetical protein
MSSSSEEETETDSEAYGKRIPIQQYINLIETVCCVILAENSIFC